MRVLYVEDNRINALLFEEMLNTRSEFELRVAEDGSEALRIAAEWQPEVLVIDGYLPDTTGLELLPRLLALPGLADVPAFMCSADSAPQDIDAAMRLGFRGYWPKPVDIALILGDLTALHRSKPVD